MIHRFPVAILAATGSVGQRFVQLLHDHPWFEIAYLTASDRSAGKTYREACRWILPQPMPETIADMPIWDTRDQRVRAPLVFSALPANAAQEIEPLFARAGAVVCSNASAYRTDAYVPILLPEVNPDHTAILDSQRSQYAWPGAIVTNPNCTSTGLTVVLKSLQDAFGLKRVLAVSLQAVSGAGYPGVASLDILDNVIPYIAGEEEKIEWEPRKMLGRFENASITLANFSLSAHANRVAVSDGHLVCASVEFETPAQAAEAEHVLAAYQAPVVSRALPSAPQPVISLLSDPDRPQPRLDRLTGNGMTTVVGRVRQDSLFHVKMVISSHNTIRGAAGGSIYNAELLYKQGYLKE